MRYQTITEGIKLITESHKSSLTFFTGLESDLDPSNNIHYPVIFLPPPEFSEQGNIENLSSNGIWTLHMEAQELLSNASTTQHKQEVLDRTAEYLRAVYFKFILQGLDVTPITFNNLTENLDFTSSGEASFKPFISLNDGVTGWMVDFKIQESNNNTLCNLNDLFN